MSGMRWGVRLLGVAAAVSMAVTASHADRPGKEEANKQLVLDMWEGVIGRADDAAVMKYIAENYIQHNPNVAQGRAGVLELTSIIRNPPPGFVGPAKKTLLRAVAEGDYVVLIWDQQQPDPASPGQTYTGQAFDMFRIENGKVVEHWDDTRKSVRPWRR